MPKYIVKQVISHRLIITYSDDFEIGDQNKWDELRGQVSEFIDEDDFDNIPSEAPTDPQEWLALYEFFPDQTFGELESERNTTAEKGGYELWCELYDENDNQIN